METTTAAEIEVRAGRREWIGLAVLALPTLLLALDFSVLFLALPLLAADLAPSGTQLLWITDIYGFLVAGFLVTMGTLGDRIGRRKLLMIGAAVFGVVSVLAAYATSAEMLIAMRALLGIAGATLLPSTLALISNMFRNARQRTTAISIWASCLLAGVAIGPLVGGVLLQFYWWGSAFLIGVPVMVLLLLTAPALLPEYRDRNAGRLDLTSVVLSLVAILPIVYGLKELADDGFGGRPLLVMLVGAVFGVIFVRRQRHLADPLVDLRLFRNRAVSAALVILMLGVGSVIGVGFLFSQYLQLVEGFSPFTAGLWMVPDAAAVIAGSLLAPVVLRWVRPGYAIGIGMAISSAGFLLLTQVQAESGLAIAVTGIVIVNFGLAPTLVLGTDLVVGSAPPEKAGSAASLSETSSELGIALGVAILGSVGAAVYRSQTADTIPAGVPAEAAEVARETLVGASSTAAQLPAEVGAALLDAAREAFTSGFAIASALSAPAMAGLAILAILVFGRVRSAEGDSETGDAGEAGDPVGPVAAGGEVDVLATPVPRGWHDLPRRGVLARYGDLVLVCEAVPGQGHRVGELVDALTETGEDQPCGRQLSRRLTGLISTAEPDDFPALCAFGPAGDGLAAVVHGNAELTLSVGGQQLRLDGRDAVTVVDRVVADEVDSVRAVVGDDGTGLYLDRPPRSPRSPMPPMPPMPNGLATGAPPDAPASATDTAPVPVLPALPAGQQEPSPPVDVDGGPRPGGPQVIGVYCKRSHFNDPNMAYCTVCGISMAQASRTPVLGDRPPVGVLVLDNGSMFPLVRDHVVGRAPEDDDAVVAGQADPMRLPDPLVSRVHARVVLDGWDVNVVDAGSTNGTFVCAPGEVTWTRLPSGATATLPPGAVAAFGHRQVHYHSYRNQDPW